MGYPLWSKNTRVFVDTSSLMNGAVATFMKNHLVPTRRGKGVPPLIVPKSVVDELNRLARNGSRDESTSRKARDAKAVVKNLCDAGNAEVIGEKDDGSFADNLFQTIFTRYRLKYRLILITQDRGLAKEILSLNSSDAVDMIYGIDAFRVGDRGVPMRWMLDPSHPSGVKSRKPDPADGFLSQSPRRGGVKKPSLSVDPFELGKSAIQLDDTPVTIGSIPSQGDTVKDAKGVPLRLGAELGRGGEGITYETDGDLVCKVYQRYRLKQFTIDKIRLMTSKKVRHPAICWPVSLAYNSRGEIIGYLMPKAQGKELQSSVFIKPLLLKAFPHWTRLHLVKLTSTILDAVAYLHSLNVLLGDINARNILVQNESSVFFVDCDSYQVQSFPCPVGMSPFLAPELDGKKLRSTLRTTEAEYFAIATLVFMLLHPGKPPYSHEGGEDPSKNVRTQHFPYPRGDQGAQGVPAGPWRFMFSHLTHRMKEAFHRVFTDGDRLSIAEWRELMDQYEYALGKKYVSDDPFPKGFKQPNQDQVERAGGEWRSCDACGQGFGAFKEEHTMCRDCFQSRFSKRHTRAYRGASDPSTPKRRVYQVSKELKRSSDELISMLKGMDFKVESHMSVVTPEMLEAINRKLAEEKKMSQRRSTRRQSSPSRQRHHVPTQQQSSLYEIAKKILNLFS